MLGEENFTSKAAHHVTTTCPPDQMFWVIILNYLIESSTSQPFSVDNNLIPPRTILSKILRLVVVATAQQTTLLHAWPSSSTGDWWPRRKYYEKKRGRAGRPVAGRIRQRKSLCFPVHLEYAMLWTFETEKNISRCVPMRWKPEIRSVDTAENEHWKKQYPKCWTDHDSMRRIKHSSFRPL